jgi:uncharacterized protein YjbI with pentapeptide repeats
MSKQGRTHASPKRRRNPKISKQNGTQTPAVKRPANDDKSAWIEYWKAQGQPWRTEPEIDAELQKYLAVCHKITPDIEQGIYPFKDTKLSRADVEWLLATHENERGPIDWNDESQREREGLDLRGTDLFGADLNGLPLARLQGGLAWSEKDEWTDKQRQMAAATLRGANLEGSHLEGAELGMARLDAANLKDACLERANLDGASLERAILFSAQLNEIFLTKANLKGAHLSNAQIGRATLMFANLEGADLLGAQMEGTIFIEAHLENTKFMFANLEGARLSGAHLEGADLSITKMKETDFSRAHLERTDLRRAQLEGADLESVFLANQDGIGPKLADVQWGSVNLAVVKWSQVNMLGDEYEARQPKDMDGKEKDRDAQINENQTAARANRQLAVVLQNQGLSEESVYFAYRAKILQRHKYVLQVLKNYKRKTMTTPFFILVYLFFILIMLPIIVGSFYSLHHQAYPSLFKLIVKLIPWFPLSFTLIFLITLLMLRGSLFLLLEKEVGNMMEPVLPFVIMLLVGLILLLLLPIVYLPPLILLLYSWPSPGYEGSLFSLLFLLLTLIYGIFTLLRRFAPWALRPLYAILRVLKIQQFIDYLLSRLVLFFEEMLAYGQYAFSLFLDLIAGYGYKPRRSVAAYIIVIIGFDILYYILGQTVGPHLSPIASLVFSVSSFHGRGFFPGTGITLDDPMTILASAEAVIGLFIEISFIATFTQRYFGK